MAQQLDPEKLKLELAEMNGWFVDQEKLTKNFSFIDFREAFSFLVRVAFEAEGMGHHPEIFNVYKDVRIQLATHDTGGKITSKDIDLAKRIDAI